MVRFLVAVGQNHTANLLRDKLHRFGWVTLQHPLYSPDLFPCDFHIFGDLKKDIHGHRFHSEGGSTRVGEVVNLSTRLKLIVSSPSGINVLTLLANTFE